MLGPGLQFCLGAIIRRTASIRLLFSRSGFTLDSILKMYRMELARALGLFFSEERIVSSAWLPADIPLAYCRTTTALCGEPYPHASPPWLAPLHPANPHAQGYSNTATFTPTPTPPSPLPRPITTAGDGPQAASGKRTVRV